MEYNSDILILTKILSSRRHYKKSLPYRFKRQTERLTACCLDQTASHQLINLKQDEVQIQLRESCSSP